ncbi:MAG: cytochrome B [Gammaproteobacteria bacterium HGW-Gammaproteobacteria-1]|jgi:cytochrome b|nr:MAG: cytochrome B [Gammaproteobacteria bacterium HGW-Gammaproteobacteria-1]
MQTAKELKVWDPLVRVFHWSLVTAFIVAFVTEDHYLALHVQAGYTIIGLVLFRLLWGVFGTRHARFTDFVRGPRAVMDYLKSLFSRRPTHYLGHNPAGGWMVVALLVALLLTTLTGLLTYGAGEAASGPFALLAGNPGGFWSEALEEIHEALANLTLLMVFVHVAGVFVSGWLHHENLVLAMLTGRKPHVPSED